jgi:DNA repair photolyase
VYELVKEIKAASLLNKHKKRDYLFLGNYTLNPYAGCSMGCIYCYTRGSKYGGDHGDEVAQKINGVYILKKQLKNRLRNGERGLIVLGSASDPYPTVEKELRLTRQILGIIKRYRFPVHVCTKSSLILRDLDILEDIGKTSVLPNDLEKLKSGVIISFSFSTLDKDIAQIVEPGAPSPIERLETMKKCSQAGFKTGIINMPVLPFLSDSEEDIGRIISTSKEYGAKYVIYGGLTLFGDGPKDCKTLYYNFLNKYYPDLLMEVEKLFRGSFAPSKRYQADLSKRFHRMSLKYGIRNKII